MTHGTRDTCPFTSTPTPSPPYHATVYRCHGRAGHRAHNLKAEHIIHNRVTFVKTKNGKRHNVPISQEVADEILGNRAGFLFPDVSYTMFRKTLKTIKPNLPHGQASHALRHTLATHFMIKNSNIITLNRTLGHARIEQTMVYTHFASDFLQDAISYNPLKGKTDV